MPNIFDTIKELEPLNGYYIYSFTVDEINHFVYGESKEEAFNFVADYINLYNGKNKQRKQSQLWQKKVRKVQENKRAKGQTN